MKRLFSTLAIALFCLCVAIPAQAQLLRWGVKGGVNMTKIDFGENYKDKMAGFFIGPMAEVNIPVVGLGVDAALLFSQKGIKADDGRVKQFGVDIPVNLKYTLGLGSMLGIYVAAGPDFYFDFKGEKNGMERKRAQVGINVGGGVKLFPGIGKRKLGFPVKEGDPVVILQPLDVLGEVLLGDIKLLGGIGEVELFGKLNEVIKAGQIHRYPPVWLFVQWFAGPFSFIIENGSRIVKLKQKKVVNY